jgi:hypothetical protein
LELKPDEGFVAEAQPDFLKHELRAERLIGTPEADVLRHEAVIPAQAQAGELEVDAARAQVLQERLLGEIRQADLIQVNKRAEQGQNQEPNGNAKQAEIDSA